MRLAGGIEARELADRTDYLELRGDVLVDLGYVLRRVGRLEEGVDAVQAGLELYERNGNRPAQRPARSLLGELLRGLG